MGSNLNDIPNQDPFSKNPMLRVQN